MGSSLDASASSRPVAEASSPPVSAREFRSKRVVSVGEVSRTVSLSFVSIDAFALDCHLHSLLTRELAPFLAQPCSNDYTGP